MHIKRFDPHYFHFPRDDAAVLSIAISHLNPRNYDGGTDEYETYRDHLHAYQPYVDPARLLDKVETDRTALHVTLIEPEMQWLRRGLLELAELAMDSTENGDWALDYAHTELTIVTEFDTACAETGHDGPADDLRDACNRFDRLADDSDYAYDPFW